MPEAEPPARAAPDDGAFTLGLLLAGLAGWVDAAGISLSHGLFVSFMSGNTTDLAASLAAENWAQGRTIAALIALFVAGVVFGEVIQPFGGRRGHALVLACETLVLGMATALHWPGATPIVFNPMFPMTFAMGLQNAAIRTAGGATYGQTFVTGTLVQVGRNTASLLGGNGGGLRLLQSLATWFSLATGATLGAWALSVSTLAALSAAVAAAGSLAVMTAVLRG